jgi:hypothetical protein
MLDKSLIYYYTLLNLRRSGLKKIKWMLFILLLIFPCVVYSSEIGTDTGKISDKPSEHKFHKGNVKKDVKQLEPNILEEYKPLIAIYDKYWKFIKDNDLDSAYNLETEDYKKVVSLREYKGLQKRSKLPVTIKAVRALEVKKKDEKEVIVRGTMWLKAAEMDTLKVFYDKWVKAGKEWRHLREIEDVNAVKKNES